MTRDEWLKTLDWRKGEAPGGTMFGRSGIVVEMDDGDILIVGDINRSGSGYGPYAERGPWNVVRWAPLYSEDE